MIALVALGLAGCTIALLAVVSDLFDDPKPYPADWTSYTLPGRDTRSASDPDHPSDFGSQGPGRTGY